VSHKDKLVDFKDGQLYQSLLQSNFLNSIKNHQAFTFCANTDGISRISHEACIEINGQKRQFFVIAGCFDKPAKADILNIKNSTSDNPCHKCLQKATRINSFIGN
jgi:hypothetical protein